MQIIKSDSSKTELLVASPEVDQWYRKNGREYSFQDAENVEPIIGKMAQVTMNRSPPPPIVVENGVSSNGVQNGHKMDVESPAASPVVEVSVSVDDL